MCHMLWKVLDVLLREIMSRLSRKKKKCLKKAFGEKAYVAFVNNSKVEPDYWMGIDIDLEVSILLQEHMKKELCNGLMVPKKYL